MISKFRSTAIVAILGAALSLVGMSAWATNLVTNGSFEALSGGAGQIGYNGSSLLTGWTNNTSGGSLGYNFV